MAGAVTGSAAKAVIAKKIHRNVNIALESASATIGLTIAAVLCISLFTGREIELGLGTVKMAMLVLTLMVSVVNFETGRTNVLQKTVQLILLVSYIILIFD